MTGKRTPPNVNRSLAIAAVPNCILVSELDPPGYRIGRAAVQRNRRRPPATNSTTAVSRASRGKSCRGRSVFDGPPRGPNEDLPAVNYDIANDGR
jgi:hypothetical protein